MQSSDDLMNVSKMFNDIEDWLSQYQEQPHTTNLGITPQIRITQIPSNNIDGSGVLCNPETYPAAVTGNKSLVPKKRDNCHLSANDLHFNVHATHPNVSITDSVNNIVQQPWFSFQESSESFPPTPQFVQIDNETEAHPPPLVRPKQ